MVDIAGFLYSLHLLLFSTLSLFLEYLVLAARQCLHGIEQSHCSIQTLYGPSEGWSIG